MSVSHRESERSFSRRIDVKISATVTAKLPMNAKRPQNSDRDVDRRENRVRQLVGELKVGAVVREPIQKSDCRYGNEERKEKRRCPDVEKFLAPGVSSKVIDALQDAVDALKSRHKCPVKNQWGTF